jgi:uncharacterized membrane protein
MKKIIFLLILGLNIVKVFGQAVVANSPSVVAISGSADSNSVYLIALTLSNNISGGAYNASGNPVTNITTLEAHGTATFAAVTITNAGTTTAVANLGVTSGGVVVTNASPAMGSILTNQTAYSSGTIYTMTASYATVTFGTTSPSITFNNAGTYLILEGANFTARGATYAATNTASIKLRRTSGTPADLTSSTISETIPIITTTSEALGKLSMPVIYTAAVNDVVVIQATLSATPSAGNVICDSAEIVAIRLY